MSTDKVTAPNRRSQHDPDASTHVEHPRHLGLPAYPFVVALSLLALSPFIVLTTAADPLTIVLGKDLHTSMTTLQVGSGLANAGYALGAVVAADLAQRLVQRRLFLSYELLFVLASVLAAFAPNVEVFTVARTLQGVGTGLLLVGALPPLIVRFPEAKLPLTAAFINIGLFGASALGPFVGNLSAHLDTWRWLFVATAVLGALGLTVGALAYERWDPLDPDLDVDLPVFPLAAAATFLPFLGSAFASKVGFTGALFWAPLAVGLVALVALILREYRHHGDPLMPVRALSTTLPVAGTLGAMLGGGAFVAALSLTGQELMARKVPILTAGAYQLPLVLGVLVAAVLFTRLVPRPALPVLAASGLLSVAAGIGVLFGLTSGADPAWVVPVASLLLGYGAGACVSPGLFLAAFGVPSNKIGRAFALVELLRSEAAFLLAPVLVVLARHIGGAAGIRTGYLIALVVAAGAFVVTIALYIGSGTRAQPADLVAWLDHGDQALHSPPLLARLRRVSIQD